ncbi:hypothetical protein ACLB2K_032506 [Fragaria x ananassa]
MDLRNPKYDPLNGFNGKTSLRGRRIPNFSGKLTSLRYLNISYASFEGEIPPAHGNLSNLNYLDLKNYVNGGYSKNLNWLSHLSSLKYLNLGGVHLSNTGVSWLHDVNMLPSLLELHLSNCQINENQLPLSLHALNFTSLLVLDISGNFINAAFPSWFFNFTNLRKLDASFNYFGDFRPFPVEFANLKFFEDLGFSMNSLQGQIPKVIGTLCSLRMLDLSSNSLDSGLEEVLKGFSNCTKYRLESLDLSNNMVEGELPAALRMLENLKELDLTSNQFSGPIPQSIASLSSLETLDISSNYLNESIPESLGELSHVVHLDLSWNFWEGSITEAHFRTLKNLIQSTLSPAEEVLPLGYGFNLKLRFSGPFPLLSANVLLNFESNLFSGPIPSNFGKLMPELRELYLSENQLNGIIPASTCNITNLTILTLRTNQLSGEFPEAWSLWSNILVIDVGYNNLSGHILISMGVPSSLAILKLNNNNFGGIFPCLIFENCTNMESIDLGSIQFTGNQPSMMPEELFILRLRSNFFSGHIPQYLCRLSMLHVLDLGDNNFSGTIPKCLKEMYSLVEGFSNVSYYDSYFEQHTLMSKGTELTYNTTVFYNLEGEIPEEVSSLIGLEFVSLTSLSHLNLSYNNLAGRIPSSTQLTTLNDSSIYEGNSLLCGVPLATMCWEDITPAGRNGKGDKDEDDYGKLGLYGSSVLGFIIGFWGVCGTLLVKNS